MSNIIVSSGMNVSAKKSELWLEEWGVRTWGVRTSSLTSSSRPLSLYTSPVVWWPRTVSTSHGTPHTADEKARHKRRNFGGLKAMKDSNFQYWYDKQYENIEVRKLPLNSARQLKLKPIPMRKKSNIMKIIYLKYNDILPIFIETIFKNIFRIRNIFKTFHNNILQIKFFVILSLMCCENVSRLLKCFI